MLEILIGFDWLLRKWSMSWRVVFPLPLRLSAMAPTRHLEIFVDHMTPRWREHWDHKPCELCLAWIRSRMQSIVLICPMTLHLKSSTSLEFLISRVSFDNRQQNKRESNNWKNQAAFELSSTLEFLTIFNVLRFSFQFYLIIYLHFLFVTFIQQ